MSKSQLGKEIADKIDACVRDCVTATMEHIVSSAKNVKLPRVAAAPAKPRSAKPAKPSKGKKAARSRSSRVDYVELAESVVKTMLIDPAVELSLKQIHEISPIKSSVAQLRRAMHRLIESGRVEQHGDRRGARYALHIVATVQPADPSNAPV